MAAATQPSTGPYGPLPSLRVLAAAERALELSSASLEEGEEGEEEEEQSGAARAASPYSPFNSCGCRSRRLPPSPRPRDSGVLPPLQLSPVVIPPLCYGAADPLTSPGAGALPPSLIDSSLSSPRSEDPSNRRRSGAACRLFQAVGRSWLPPAAR